MDAHRALALLCRYADPGSVITAYAEPSYSTAEDANGGYMDVPAGGGGDEDDTGYMDTSPNDDSDDDV